MIAATVFLTQISCGFCWNLSIENDKKPIFQVAVGTTTKISTIYQMLISRIHARVHRATLSSAERAGRRVQAVF